MINAKRANALLWTGNVLLIIGIVAFAFQYLIFPELKTHQDDPPVTVPPLTQPNDPTDTTALGKLPNPLLPPTGPMGKEGPRGPVRLIGTDRILDDPKADTAYLELPTRRLNVNAYVGEPVRDDSTGVEVPELSGWKLKSVTPKSALFSSPTGDVTLQLEEFVATPGAIGPAVLPGNMMGQPWETSKFTTKKDATRTTESQEAWTMDRKEVEWAAANVDSILRDVSLEPYAGGGLKINALPESGFAAERGLKAGDVIRSVNSQPIESIAKLGEVMKGLSKNATTLTVQVDRSGRIYTLTYTVPRAR
jgi:hypothetical protein